MKSSKSEIRTYTLLLCPKVELIYYQSMPLSANFLINEWDVPISSCIWDHDCVGLLTNCLSWNLTVTTHSLPSAINYEVGQLVWVLVAKTDIKFTTSNFTSLCWIYMYWAFVSWLHRFMCIKICVRLKTRETETILKSVFKKVKVICSSVIVYTH